MYYFSGILVLVALGIVSKRLQFETYSFAQGWWLVPTAVIVPKSIPIGGVHYLVISFFYLGFELRWFVWRRARVAH